MWVMGWVRFVCVHRMRRSLNDMCMLERSRTTRRACWAVAGQRSGCNEKGRCARNRAKIDAQPRKPRRMGRPRPLTGLPPGAEAGPQAAVPKRQGRDSRFFGACVCLGPSVGQTPGSICSAKRVADRVRPRPSHGAPKPHRFGRLTRPRWPRMRRPRIGAFNSFGRWLDATSCPITTQQKVSVAGCAAIHVCSRRPSVSPPAASVRCPPARAFGAKFATTSTPAADIWGAHSRHAVVRAGDGAASCPCGRWRSVPAARLVNRATISARPSMTCVASTGSISSIGQRACALRPARRPPLYVLR